MAKNTLTITDNRTGKQYELSIENNGTLVTILRGAGLLAHAG